MFGPSLGISVCRTHGLSSPQQVKRALMLDLDARFGLFKDTGGTTPAVASGDPVALWRDQSGNGNDLSQATAANQPTLAPTGSATGAPAVKFTGSGSQYMTNALFNALNGLAGATVFLVVGTDAYSSIFVPNAGFQFDINPPTGNYVWTTVGAGAYGLDTDPTYQVKCISARFDGTQAGNARLAVWLCGLVDSITYHSTPVAALASSAGLRIGSATNGTQYLDGPLVRVVVHSAALTDAEVAQQHAYLKATHFSGLQNIIIGQGDSLMASYPANSGAGVPHPTKVSQLLGSGWTVHQFFPDAGTVYQTAEVGAKSDRILQLNANAGHARQRYRGKEIRLICAGINDLYYAVAPATILANIKSLCQAAHSLGAITVVETVPSRSDTGVSATFEADRTTLNNSIMADSSGDFDLKIDIRGSAIEYAGSNNDPVLGNGDHVHLSQAGYNAWAQIEYNALSAWLATH